MVRLLLLFLVSVDLSVRDLIKLGRALVAMSTVREKPCDNTSCLSCLPREAVNIIIIIIIICILVLTIGCIFQGVVRDKLLGSIQINWERLIPRLMVGVVVF